VNEPRVLYGGGWPDMRMARAIEEAATKTPGAAGLMFWWVPQHMLVRIASAIDDAAWMSQGAAVA
jgi:hypothetical protein